MKGGWCSFIVYTGVYFQLRSKITDPLPPAEKKLLRFDNNLKFFSILGERR